MMRMCNTSSPHTYDKELVSQTLHTCAKEFDTVASNFLKSSAHCPLGEHHCYDLQGPQQTKERVKAAQDH